MEILLGIAYLIIGFLVLIIMQKVENGNVTYYSVFVCAFTCPFWPIFLYLYAGVWVMEKIVEKYKWLNKKLF